MLFHSSLTLLVFDPIGFCYWFSIFKTVSEPIDFYWFRFLSKACFPANVLV